jgi:hypothetical protein
MEKGHSRGPTRPGSIALRDIHWDVQVIATIDTLRKEAMNSFLSACRPVSIRAGTFRPGRVRPGRGRPPNRKPGRTPSHRHSRAHLFYAP